MAEDKTVEMVQVSKDRKESLRHLLYKLYDKKNGENKEK